MILSNNLEKMIAALHLPLTEPILVFTVIISILFLAPLLLKRINIPDIIGLIIAGVIIGPKGFNILSGDIALSIFGSIGLLYLMFLAGLEIDLNDFFRRKREGTLFGLLTFLAPFLPSLFVFRFLLGFRPETSLLISIMLASHTLVSYPILGRFGIKNHKIITVTIAGTIIADTLVLLLLGLVADLSQVEISGFFWLKTVLNFSLFFIYVLFLLPKGARWILKYQAGDSNIQYIFVLTAIFISSTIANFLNIEPLIGAFFTGLSLNRLIPRSSSLMNRVVFIGNTLFIPFFLISIGMLVDIHILFSNVETLKIILVIIALGFSGKFLAAWIFQKLYKQDGQSRNLMFGLSTSRAASAIAIMIIGQQLNLVNNDILNSTVFLILVSCLFSSYFTQRAAGKISTSYIQEREPTITHAERIMVSVANPENIERLIDFSLMVKNPHSTEPIFPLTIVPGSQTPEQRAQQQKTVSSIMEQMSASDKKSELITRIDVNIVNGISRVIREMNINKIIIGWNSRTTTLERLFGTVLDKLLDKTDKMLMVAKLESNAGLIGNIQVFLPPHCELEKGFTEMISTNKNLAKQINRKITFYGNRGTLDVVRKLTSKSSFIPVLVESRIDEVFFDKFSNERNIANDLLIFIKARKNTVSHSKLIDKYPRIIQKHFCYNSIVLIYPEQKTFKTGLYKLYNLN